MPHTFEDRNKNHEFQFNHFFKPVESAMMGMAPLQSKCNRPLQMSFEDHLKALVFFHLEEHHSAKHLLQVLEQDDFARNHIAPRDGIKKAVFLKPPTKEALNSSCMSFKNCRNRPKMFCRTVALILAISSASTVL